VALELDAVVRVHVPVNVPVPLLRNDTVPVGVVAAVELVSVTVALQLVTSLATTVDGMQVTVVTVVCPFEIEASSFVFRYVPFAPPITYIRLL
jgi:hypothetical protein